MVNPLQILKCESDNPDWDGECHWFVIKLDRAYARTLVRRIRILAKVQKLDGDAYELYLWDCKGDFFSSNDDGEYEEGVSEAQRTECNQCVVRISPSGLPDAKVLWMCYPKHSDVTITTEEIGYGTLLELSK